MSQDSRLLTAESLEEIKSLHRPIDRVNLETGQVGRPYCTVCWLPAPCDIALLLDHIAAQAEQIDRQAVVMAVVEAWGDGEATRSELALLYAYLGQDGLQVGGPLSDEQITAWRSAVDAIKTEVSAIRRHGVEVAQRRQA